MKKLTTKIHTIQKARDITNNTQRAAIRLLAANGSWLPRSEFGKIPSATARIRDLRKDEFGGFDVECKSSDELRRTSRYNTYYYRINPNKVTYKQLDTLFPAE